jgi:hypothetical protein
MNHFDEDIKLVHDDSPLDVFRTRLLALFTVSLRSGCTPRDLHLELGLARAMLQTLINRVEDAAEGRRR